jgi:hypothetical protein
MNNEEQKTKDMTQTAVEWLEDRYRPKGYITAEEFNQAKEMFKQQMIEFGYACTKQIEMNEAGELLMVKSPEELYNETYSRC